MSSPSVPPDPEATLDLLRQIEPRAGLEGRMLAQLGHAARSRRISRPGLLHLLPHVPGGRLAAGGLTLAAVALLAAGTAVYRSNHRTPAFVVAHAPGQSTATSAAGHGVAAAAAVAVAQHAMEPPFQHHRRHTRSARAEHTRVPLPPGAALATHRNLRALPAQR